LLIAAIAEWLTPQLRPKYVVSVEVRMYETSVGMVRQGYLEIREVKSQAVVTALEVLSPVNKRPGKGRQTYESKRERVLGSSTHLVEIDLLRAWQSMTMYTDAAQSHYRILVSRGDCRPMADLYQFNLQDDAIPAFPLPLRTGDPEPILAVQKLLERIYERGAYDLKLDYTAEPTPPLSDRDRAWIEALLISKGLR
jgi:hypothetical protein